MSSVYDLTFNVEDKGALTPLTLAIDRAVIAGWTGRDPVARDKHIAELEAIGIARPGVHADLLRCSARRGSRSPTASRSAAKISAARSSSC